MTRDDERPPTGAERFPLLTERGRKLKEWMWHQLHAPRFVGRCGDRPASRRARSGCAPTRPRWAPRPVASRRGAVPSATS